MGYKSDALKELAQMVAGQSEAAARILQPVGIKPTFGRTPRTKQGPLPPTSVRSPKDQQQFDPIEANREDAILSGSTRYRGEDGEVYLNRNYGSDYAPLGQPRRQTNRQSESYGDQRADQARDQTNPSDPDFKEGRMNFDEISENPDVDYDSHHRAGLKMYAWAFKGLDEAGAKEMREYLRTLGVFGGDSAYNRMDLPKGEVHSPLHSSLRYGDENLEYLGDKLLKRYKGWEKKSVKERKKAIKHFVKTVQKQADEQTYARMSNRNALKRSQKRL